MRRLVFAFGVLAVALAATQANADFAVVRFKSGYCRVWTNTAEGPQDFQYLAFRRSSDGHHWWQHLFSTAAEAQVALHEAVSTHRCHVGLLGALGQ